MIRAFVFAFLCVVGVSAMAQDVNFGNDDGEWSIDGECDDRRFFGAGMAASLSWEFIGADATDCREAFKAGTVQLWVPADAQAATQCNAIDFGNDNGEYPMDGECDDRRFEGPAVARILSPDNVKGDATDCSRLCSFGVISVREY